jgi:hypothetical protein
MLSCVYHPIDPMRVVEEEEAHNLKGTGVWFDCPAKAKKYRSKIEDEIKQESEVAESKAQQPKRKSKGK